LTENIITLLELYPTWNRTASCNGEFSDPTGSIATPFAMNLPAGENMSCIVNNTQNAVISGKKFEDMDGNGASNVGSGLSGWTITYASVDNPETEADETGAVTGYDVTDSEGDYSFLVPPGTYKVCESPEPSWYQSTSPTGIANINCENPGSNYDYGYTVTVTAGQIVTGKDFGNYRLGSITGVKWHDVNADGVATEDETGLSGWNIELHKDLGEGFEWIDAETTNGSGVYTFTNLAPGVYRVYETQQAGWVQTYPTAGYHTVTVSSGVSVVDKKFGNVGDSTISGTKWIDWNGNGIQDESDTFASTTSFTMELYKVEGESETLASTTNTSLANGGYTFVGLLPGTYIVREVDASGWAQTYPSANGEYVVELGINQDATGKDFGNGRTFSIFGSKFNDQDQNGSWGEEYGIEGWGIFATPMVEEVTEDEESTVLVADTGETRSAKSTVTDEYGDYEFSFLPHEYGWWRITEENRAGWVQSAPLAGYFDVLIDASNIKGLLFGNWAKPRVIVEKWKDVNNDGIRNWTEIATGTPGVKDVDEVYSEPAVAGWPMFLVEEVATSSEGVMDLHVVAMAYTSATGTAVLESPKTGTGYFYVYEGDAAAWNRTYPTNAGFIFPRVVTYDYGVTMPSGYTLDTEANFLVGGLMAGDEYTTGAVNGFEGPSVPLSFGNYTAPEPTPTPTTSGGGGGNGPIVGSIGSVLGVAIGPNGGGSVAGASTGPGASCTTYITAFMGPNRKNDTEQVRRLQTVLKTIEGMNVDVNGIYDTKTFEAVKAFQLKYADEILKPWGLTAPTGFTYLTTRKKLNEVFCAGMKFPLTPEEQAIIDAFLKKPAVTPPAPRPRSTTPASNGSQGSNNLTTTTQSGGGTETVVTDTGTTTEDASGGLFSRIKKWFGR
jgi:protocatechuate 3,4-dioxygenase beta subunit